MNTALEYSTRVVQEGGRRCKKSALNDLVHLNPLRIPLGVLVRLLTESALLSQRNLALTAINKLSEL